MFAYHVEAGDQEGDATADEGAACVAAALAAGPVPEGPRMGMALDRLLTARFANRAKRVAPFIAVLAIAGAAPAMPRPR
ncbi:hypothetical protein, partial [Mycobacterium tuberculosis]|uniref:hypothetical protein n=1 Tax=Mycobacterium tuberculosis TaxID=1773 RepID=UPI001AE4C878|nr:hypothetical protein [Mycobacterium tuberculosis]